MATDLGKVGMVMKGDYNSASTYEVLDVVQYNSGSYIAKQSVPVNTPPTNGTYWQQAIDPSGLLHLSGGTMTGDLSIDHRDADSTFIIGNQIPYGSSGASKGTLVIFSANNKAGYFYTENNEPLTDNRYYKLPDKSGILALDDYIIKEFDFSSVSDTTTQLTDSISGVYYVCGKLERDKYGGIYHEDGRNYFKVVTSCVDGSTTNIYVNAVGTNYYGGAAKCTVLLRKM